MPRADLSDQAPAASVNAGRTRVDKALDWALRVQADRDQWRAHATALQATLDAERAERDRERGLEDAAYRNLEVERDAAEFRSEAALAELAARNLARRWWRWSW